MVGNYCIQYEGICLISLEKNLSKRMNTFEILALLKSSTGQQYTLTKLELI